MEPPTPPLDTLMRPGFPVPIRLRNDMPTFSSPVSRSIARIYPNVLALQGISEEGPIKVKGQF
jgi:hypothetical protein